MFGRNTTYTLIAIPDDRLERQVIASIPVQEPGYMHSFGMTESYPGEPIFVAPPEATAEDQGGILSVVLDGNKGTSYLLVLDAISFSEIGRAEVPHYVPFGFHGQYFRA